MLPAEEPLSSSGFALIAFLVLLQDAGEPCGDHRWDASPGFLEPAAQRRKELRRFAHILAVSAGGLRLECEIHRRIEIAAVQAALYRISVRIERGGGARAGAVAAVLEDDRQERRTVLAGGPECRSGRAMHPEGVAGHLHHVALRQGPL